MLKHWTVRQGAGKIPLEFKKATMDTSEDDEGDSDSDKEPSEGGDSPLGRDNGQSDEGTSEGGRSSVGSDKRDESQGNATENPSRVGWLLKRDDRTR
jgi:hypothetical protein